MVKACDPRASPPHGCGGVLLSAPLRGASQVWIDVGAESMLVHRLTSHRCNLQALDAVQNQSRQAVRETHERGAASAASTKRRCNSGSRHPGPHPVRPRRVGRVSACRIDSPYTWCYLRSKLADTGALVFGKGRPGDEATAPGGVALPRQVVVLDMVRDAKTLTLLERRETCTETMQLFHDHLQEPAFAGDLKLALF